MGECVRREREGVLVWGRGGDSARGGKGRDVLVCAWRGGGCVRRAMGRARLYVCVRLYMYACMSASLCFYVFVFASVLVYLGCQRVHLLVHACICLYPNLKSGVRHRHHSAVWMQCSYVAQKVEFLPCSRTSECAGAPVRAACNYLIRIPYFRLSFYKDAVQEGFT